VSLGALPSGKRRLKSLSSKKPTDSSPKGTYSVKKSWKLSLIRAKYTDPAYPMPRSALNHRNRLVHDRRFRGGGRGAAGGGVLMTSGLTG